MTAPPTTLLYGWRRAVASLTAFALLSGSFAPALAQVPQQQQQQTPSTDDTSTGISNTIRLRQSQQPVEQSQRPSDAMTGDQEKAEKPYVPGEFEGFVKQVNGGGATDEPVRRFGAELLTGRQGDATEYSPQVPPDYLISPGDEVVLTIWGSVDADLRLTVDRSGRVSIPRVGSVLVSGVRYGDLPAVLTQRVSQVFKNFQLNVALGKLRSIRIYVTGFTAKPGSYTVSSLSTIVNALMRTGGPSAAGSFRDIELRRDGKLISTFDMYDLLLKGDKSADRALQAEDVIFIAPVGPQVAVIGSVNKPAIFELRAGETIADLMQMAGGFTAVADRNRVLIQRLQERDKLHITQLTLPNDAAVRPANGDVIRAFSAVDATLPRERQNVRVHVEGEVAKPGDVILSPGSSVADALQAAGGLTPSAYVFGTDISRVSVRRSQEENYDRALRDLETDFARVTSSRKAFSADEAQAQAQQATSAARLIDRLRQVRPTGRIILQIDPSVQQLPNLALEDGDRINIPAVPVTVGVFGSVYNGGNYLFIPGSNLQSYIRQAGGPTRGADKDGAFTVRANGTVVSARQRHSWFSSGDEFAQLPAEPGDTVFVPEELDKTDFLQFAKEWTQILYQFGLGAAALKTIKQ